MTSRLRLAGLLADPGMLSALGAKGCGPGTPLAGRLAGGRRCGIDAGDWPALADGDGDVATVLVDPNRALARYAGVMGLEPQNLADGPPVLGLKQQAFDDRGFLPEPWQVDLAIAIARQIVEAPACLEPSQIAARLPMIGVWAESRLRAASSPSAGGDLVVPRGGDDVRLHGRTQPYAGFFAVDVWTLSHRTHAGGFTPPVTREGFVMGDAVVVLPWDPVRDRVLLIEQFRFAPALRQDSQPWLLEPIAGRIDAGEAIEDAARREALEEADLQLGRLFPAVHHYPSPGAVTEFLYLYVGIADLPDGSAGVHGLEGETEDIRGHLLDRNALLDMVMRGQITNGPLAMLALWLDRQKGVILDQLALS